MVLREKQISPIYIFYCKTLRYHKEFVIVFFWMAERFDELCKFYEANVMNVHEMCNPIAYALFIQHDVSRGRETARVHISRPPGRLFTFENSVNGRVRDERREFQL